jgi:hypothetical protein
MFNEQQQVELLILHETHGIMQQELDSEKILYYTLNQQHYDQTYQYETIRMNT